jgi:hypothetical protein
VARLDAVDDGGEKRLRSYSRYIDEEGGTSS